jgi:acetate kinase
VPEEILVVNAGSTSLKLSVVRADGSTAPASSLDELGATVVAVGHRIVHMGDLAIDAALIEDWLLPYIEEGAQIAPLHNRPALDALADARRALPDVPHVAVSDSYFHRTISREAATYAVPERWGLVRLGFHGLSVQWVVRQVDAPRLVVCHLGGGCSVTAVHDGRSVDTTMGYTPVDGVPMITRSGSVDPGALTYLLREGVVTLEELDRALEHESGLAALGGLDSDRGFAVFTYRVAQAVAAMAAALGGLDAVAFTGGIGENRDDVRRAIVERVAFLGDFRVEVVPAREELVIADAVRALLAAG